MRVAVVDDDEQVRDVLSRLLARLGAEVEAASCGEDALALIGGAMRDDERRFDLAFVDLSMPWSRSDAGSASGGLELAAALRAEEPGAPARELRLVALTGADRALEPDSRRSGFDAFLQKPAGLEALRRELELAAAARREG